MLFLDEPTVGLDVEAARDIRAYIRSWIEEKPGRTVVLTTHLMHEAEELCDRVAIIHRGRIVACDTPAALRRQAAGGTFFVLTTDAWDGSQPVEATPGVLRVDVRALSDGRAEVRLQLDEDATLLRVLGALAAHGVRVHALRKVEPSLEDAFVRIVGRRMEEADAEATP
ncbi:Fluoroquinolones export ATP-binding protein [bacterium HR32]|nr:Fluoroquinolones export ATP-binding protein [bacterium HR32]